MREKYYINCSRLSGRYFIKEIGVDDILAEFDTKKEAEEFIKYKEKGECVLDYSDIDDYDEISGDEQQTLIYCKTHKQYEWKWLLKRENI